ncbi:hypothetical protein [Micromonospora sp. NPDC126480]|uniref:hypothetical protein n=1 Tax=Micromonospora sp. NPDC126480 TaxID=3155312 RepID=UPI00332FFF56
MVRDEDIGRRLYRPLHLYSAYGGPDEVPWAKVKAIIEMVDRSPAAWTPRPIYEEIREAGRHDIPEELVNMVMNDLAGVTVDKALGDSMSPVDLR